MVDKNELYHYGILGMKWGVRRYQNKDGSLTPAGKKRYSQLKEEYSTKEDIKVSAKQLEKKGYRMLSDFDDYYDSAKNDYKKMASGKFTPEQKKAFNEHMKRELVRPSMVDDKDLIPEVVEDAFFWNVIPLSKGTKEKEAKFLKSSDDYFNTIKTECDNIVAKNSKALANSVNTNHKTVDSILIKDVVKDILENESDARYISYIARHKDDIVREELWDEYIDPAVKILTKEWIKNGDNYG